MARRRGGLPDWLIYGVVIAGVVYAVTRDGGPAPLTPSPPPVIAGDGAPLAPASPFDPEVQVEVRGAPRPGLGTTFAIDGDGVWLTARHVVEGCRVASLVVGPRSGVPAGVAIDRSADIALLRTDGGPQPLTSALEAPLRVGQPAFHIGFPGGQPGEAATRLIGRETLRVIGRGERSEPVLAWAEVARSEGLEGSLAGLSGGPALDGGGRILGVTIAESPRRGRIYTTAPDTLNQTLDAAGVEPPPGDGEFPLNPGTLGRIADILRRDMRVAMVVCLES